MKKLQLMLFMGIGCACYCHAQLTTEHNAIRQGDELIKYQVEYKDPGEKGTNVFWDFSNLKTINEEYTVTYTDAPLLKDSLFIMNYDNILHAVILTTIQN